MMKMITQEHFPLVSRIKITEFGSGLRKSVPDFTGNITQLKLKMDNASPPTYQSVNEFIECFPLVCDLNLKNAPQHILRNIWKSSLCFSLTEFSMTAAAKSSGSFSSHETFELDSILTGFSATFCKKLLVNEVNTKVFFDLESFDIDKWMHQWKSQIGHTLEHKSVACFESKYITF
jgi:hypothetical protein